MNNRFGVELNKLAYDYVASGIGLESFVKDMCKKYTDSPEFRAFCSETYREQRDNFERNNFN